MRTTVIFLAITLAGCHGISPLDSWLDRPTASIMPLWGIYQHCMTTSDTDKAFHWLEQLELTTMDGSAPPNWVTFWGMGVAKPPLRTSVDPRALGVACRIRTAMLLAERNRPSEAQALYQHIVLRYANAEWSFYRRQAEEGLNSLSNDDRALVAQRTLIPISQPH